MAILNIYVTFPIPCLEQILPRKFYRFNRINEIPRITHNSKYTGLYQDVEKKNQLHFWNK